MIVLPAKVNTLRGISKRHVKRCDARINGLSQPHHWQLRLRAPGKEWESFRIVNPAGLYWQQVDSQGQWANRKVILTP